MYILSNTVVYLYERLPFSKAFRDHGRSQGA